MTRAEFNELGVTEEQYEEMFGEKAVFDDEVAPAAEATVEVPEMVETPAEEPAVEATAEAPKAEEAQATVDAIVPAEAKAEVIKTGAAMSFANIKAAAEYLAKELNLKLTNTLDGLYKTKRRGTSKNHGYIVTFNEDKTVALAKIEK